MQNYFSELEKKKLFLEIPFSKGFALQNYRCAEYGIIEANNNEYQYWYIDFSMGSDQIKNWTQDRIINLLILINKFKVKPIFHGNFKAPIVSDVDEIRKAAIEYTKNEIDIAYQFSSPLIIHAGAIVEPRTVRQAKQKALDDLLLSLEKLIEYANDFGVELWLENLSNYK